MVAFESYVLLLFLLVAASSYSTRGDITDAVINAAAASDKRAHL